MIGRRKFLQVMGVGSYAAVSGAQAPETVKRIGVLVQGQADRPMRPPQGALDALRAKGWIEGQNLFYEFRVAERADQLPALAQELVQAKVDLIFTFGTPETRAAKAATTTIPILFDVGEDPVANGLVSSMSHPGGNLTGIAYGIIDEKLLEYFKLAMPKAKRVMMPVATPAAAVQRAARASGLEIVPFPVPDPTALHAFLAAAQTQRPDGVVVPNVAWMVRIGRRIAEGLLADKMPSIAPWPEFTRDGGLLSYGPEPMFARRITIVDQLLRGAKPRDLPVELPRHYRPTVNLVTAKVLGVNISPTFLMLVSPEDVIRS